MSSWWMQFCILLYGKLYVCLAKLVRLAEGQGDLKQVSQHCLPSFWSIAGSQLINW